MNILLNILRKIPSGLRFFFIILLAVGAFILLLGETAFFPLKLIGVILALFVIFMFASLFSSNAQM